jgi:hypothetical protein
VFVHRWYDLAMRHLQGKRRDGSPVRKPKPAPVQRARPSLVRRLSEPVTMAVSRSKLAVKRALALRGSP